MLDPGPGCEWLEDVIIASFAGSWYVGDLTRKAVLMIQMFSAVV